MTKKEVIREILTEDELQTLLSKEIQNPRIRQVRDIFIFSCFTGLAYIDAKRLKRSEIVIGMDGEKWIYTRRKKTDSPTRIPILPIVQEIMETYKDHPQCSNRDCLLPVPSSAKLNAYLKEVADIRGINKLLTFHIARHTFATTVTLMITVNWHIGKLINKNILQNKRAEYGKAVISGLSELLTSRYGSGYSMTHLTYCRTFEAIYPAESIIHAMREQLSWTHIRIILAIKDEVKRDFYLHLSIKERWKTRQLIASQSFYRSVPGP